MNAFVVVASFVLAGPARAGASEGLPPTDLALTITDSPDPVGAGMSPVASSRLTYTLTVANLGSAPAVGVTVSIAAPSEGVFPDDPFAGPCVPHPDLTFTCPLGPIAPGDAASVDVDYMVAYWAPAVATGRATVSADNPDANPSNNTASATTTVLPTVSGNCTLAWVEGDSGLEPRSCWIYRVGDQVPTSTVSYSFGGGTATPGVDFVAHSGVVTFGPGETDKEVLFEQFGDTLPEPDDTFRVQLTNLVGAVALSDPSMGWDVIPNDDRGAVVGDLSHGFVYRGPVPSHPTERVADIFEFRMGIPASYEVVVDEVSGDAGSLRPATGSNTAGQGMIFGVPIGTGGGSSLRIPNFHVAVAERTVAVAGDGCNADCGPDDTYRLRVYETTLSGGRFDTVGGQENIVMLQNAGDEAAHCDVVFWRPSGGPMAAWREFVVPPRGSHILRASDVPALANLSGSITVVHDAAYGTLTGKVSAFNPATGFSFDSLLAPRPR